MPERTFLLQQLAKWPSNADCDFTDTSIESLQLLLSDCIDNAREHVARLRSMEAKIAELTAC